MAVDFELLGNGHEVDGSVGLVQVFDSLVNRDPVAREQAFRYLGEQECLVG